MVEKAKLAELPPEMLKPLQDNAEEKKKLADAVAGSVAPEDAEVRRSRPVLMTSGLLFQ